MFPVKTRVRALILTSGHRDQTKGKKRGKKGRNQRRILACGRKWHACHGIVRGFCRPVIRFGKVWKPIVMVCSPRQNDVHLKKKKKEEEEEIRTHTFPMLCWTMTMKRNVPQRAISMHHEKCSYYKYSFYVLKSVCFVILLQGCFFFMKPCFNYVWWNTYVPYQGPTSSTVGLWNDTSFTW